MRLAISHDSTDTALRLDTLRATHDSGLNCLKHTAMTAMRTRRRRRRSRRRRARRATARTRGWRRRAVANRWRAATRATIRAAAGAGGRGAVREPAGSRAGRDRYGGEPHEINGVARGATELTTTSGRRGYDPTSWRRTGSHHVLRDEAAARVPPSCARGCRRCRCEGGVHTPGMRSQCMRPVVGV